MFPMTRRPSADRKSTRLNSSHLVISYAVFCLKKKKNQAGPVGNRLQEAEAAGAERRRILATSAWQESPELRFWCDARVCADRPLFFFFNDTATTEIYTLSLHDALPI